MLLLYLDPLVIVNLLGDALTETHKYYDSISWGRDLTMSTWLNTTSLSKHIPAAPGDHEPSPIQALHWPNVA